MSASIADEFRIRFETWRQAKRLTQQEVADSAGLSQATIAKIENGTHCPTLDQVERLATALGISARRLLP